MKLDQALEFLKLQHLLNDETLSSAERNHLEQLFYAKFGAISSSLNLLDNYQELEMTNERLDVHEDVSYTKDMVSLHSHSFYEILFCKSGNLQYLLSDTRYQIQSNDVIFVPPGVSHRPLFLEQLSVPYRRIVLWASTEFIDLLNRSFSVVEQHSELSKPQISHIMRPSGMLSHQIEQLFDNLLLEKSKCRPGSELYCIGLFTQLFCLFCRISFYQDSYLPKPETTALTDEIIHYIENHFSEEISLKSVAAEFLISQSALSHLFKKQMDTSFYRLVTQRRLIEAKNYILSGIPIKEVPKLCGFSDYSVFYKAFVKEYGISPKQFQKREQPYNATVHP